MTNNQDKSRYFPTVRMVCAGAAGLFMASAAFYLSPSSAAEMRVIPAATVDEQPGSGMETASSVPDPVMLALAKTQHNMRR